MIFFVCVLNLIFTFSVCSNQYATLDQYKHYHEYSVHRQFANLYPNEAKKDDFKPSVASEEEFLTKYPKTTIIKISTLTKELGGLLWVFNTCKNYNEHPDKQEFITAMSYLNGLLEEYKDRNNSQPTNENISSEDLLYWFYKQNHNEKLLKVNHAIELSIHSSMFQIIDRNTLKTVNHHAEISEEDEWKICKHFADSINQMLVDEQEKKAFTEKSEQTVKQYVEKKFIQALTFWNSSFLKRQDAKSISDFFMDKMEKVNRDDILRTILKSEREQKGQFINLFRATKPCNKNGISLLDSTNKKKDDSHESEYLSFSYGTSLFSFILLDPGACPLYYWTERTKMQWLKIPLSEISHLIKDRIIVYVPNFSNIFNFGEWHPRTSLPQEVFNQDGSWNMKKRSFNCFNSMGKSPAAIKTSFTFFNSKMSSNLHEISIIERLIIPYLTILNDKNNEETDQYKENFKIYLDKIK